MSALAASLKALHEQGAENYEKRVEKSVASAFCSLPAAGSSTDAPPGFDDDDDDDDEYSSDDGSVASYVPGRTVGGIAGPFAENRPHGAALARNRYSSDAGHWQPAAQPPPRAAAHEQRGVGEDSPPEPLEPGELEVSSITPAVAPWDVPAGRTNEAYTQPARPSPNEERRRAAERADGVQRNDGTVEPRSRYEYGQSEPAAAARAAKQHEPSAGRPVEQPRRLETVSSGRQSFNEVAFDDDSYGELGDSAGFPAPGAFDDGDGREDDATERAMQRRADADEQAERALRTIGEASPRRRSGTVRFDDEEEYDDPSASPRGSHSIRGQQLQRKQTKLDLTRSSSGLRQRSPQLMVTPEQRRGAMMKRRLSLWKVKVYQDIALRRHNLYELVLYTIYFSFFIAGIVVRFPTSTNMLRQQGAVRDALLDRQKWNDDEKHFEDIHDKEHVWRWLEGPLISSMYGGDEPEPIFRHGNDPNSTLNSAEINAWRLLHSKPKLSGTQLLGRIELRQARVTGSTCATTLGIDMFGYQFVDGGANVSRSQDTVRCYPKFPQSETFGDGDKVWRKNPASEVAVPDETFYNRFRRWDSAARLGSDNASKMRFYARPCKTVDKDGVERWRRFDSEYDSKNAKSWFSSDSVERGICHDYRTSSENSLPKEKPSVMNCSDICFKSEMKGNAEFVDDFWGRIPSFGYSGYSAELPRERTDAVAALQELKRSNFIDAQTRGLSVSFTLHNPNQRYLIVVSLSFYIQPSGHVDSYPRISTVQSMSKMFWNVKPWRSSFMEFDKRFYMGWYPVAVWALLLIVFACIEIVKLLPRGIHYFKDIWNLFEVGFIFSLVQVLSKMSNLISVSERAQETLTLCRERDRMCDMMPLRRAFRSLLIPTAFASMLAVLKFFKFMKMSHRMNMLWRVLELAVFDLLSYIVMLMMVVLAFAVFATNAFGFQVKQFHNFATSFLSLLYWAVGDFSVVEYAEIKAAQPFLAPIFFFTYVMLVTLITINMFVSILSDFYNSVRQERTQFEEAEANLSLGTHGFAQVLEKAWYMSIPSYQLEEVLAKEAAENDVYKLGEGDVVNLRFNRQMHRKEAHDLRSKRSQMAHRLSLRKTRHVSKEATEVMRSGAISGSFAASSQHKADHEHDDQQKFRHSNPLPRTQSADVEASLDAPSCTLRVIGVGTDVSHFTSPRTESLLRQMRPGDELVLEDEALEGATAVLVYKGKEPPRVMEVSVMEGSVSSTTGEVEVRYVISEQSALFEVRKVRSLEVLVGVNGDGDGRVGFVNAQDILRVSPYLAMQLWYRRITRFIALRELTNSFKNEGEQVKLDSSGTDKTGTLGWMLVQLGKLRFWKIHSDRQTLHDLVERFLERKTIFARNEANRLRVDRENVKDIYKMHDIEMSHLVAELELFYEKYEGGKLRASPLAFWVSAQKKPLKNVLDNARMLSGQTWKTAILDYVNEKYHEAILLEEEEGEAVSEGEHKMNEMMEKKLHNLVATMRIGGMRNRKFGGGGGQGGQEALDEHSKEQVKTSFGAPKLRKKSSSRKVLRPRLASHHSVYVGALGN